MNYTHGRTQKNWNNTEHNEIKWTIQFASGMDQKMMAGQKYSGPEQLGTGGKNRGSIWNNTKKLPFF